MSEDRLAAVRGELEQIAARLAEIASERERRMLDQKLLVAGLANPVGEDLEIEKVDLPDPPRMLVVERGPEGVRISNKVTGTRGDEDAEFREFARVLAEYRRGGAVAAAAISGLRAIDIVSYLTDGAERWPVVDERPVLPLFDEERAAFLRNAHTYCASFGSIEAAADASSKPRTDARALIDEGVAMGIFEWPPGDDLDQAVRAFMSEEANAG